MYNLIEVLPPKQGRLGTYHLVFEAGPILLVLEIMRTVCGIFLVKSGPYDEILVPILSGIVNQDIKMFC